MGGQIKQCNPSYEIPALKRGVRAVQGLPRRPPHLSVLLLDGSLASKLPLTRLSEFLPRCRECRWFPCPPQSPSCDLISTWLGPPHHWVECSSCRMRCFIWGCNGASRAHGWETAEVVTLKTLGLRRAWADNACHAAACPHFSRVCGHSWLLCKTWAKRQPFSYGTVR